MPLFWNDKIRSGSVRQVRCGGFCRDPEESDAVLIGTAGGVRLVSIGTVNVSKDIVRQVG